MKKINIRYLLLSSVVFITASFSVLLGNTKAYAITITNDELTRLALIQALEDAYVNDDRYLKKTIVIYDPEDNNYSSILTKYANPPAYQHRSFGYVVVPTFGSSSNSTVTISNAFASLAGNKSVEDLGYENVSSEYGTVNQNTTISQMSFTANGQEYILNGNKTGGITCSTTNGAITSCQGSLVAQVSNSNTTFQLVYNNDDTWATGFELQKVVNGNVEQVGFMSDYHGWDASASVEENLIRGFTDSLYDSEFDTSTIGFQSKVSTEIYGGTYELRGSYDQVLGKLGLADLANTGWDAAHTYALYTAYLKDKGISYTCNYSSGSDAMAGGYYAYQSSPGLWCRINASADSLAKIKVAVVENGKLVMSNMLAVVEWLSHESNYSGLNLEDFDNQFINYEKEVECKTMIEEYRKKEFTSKLQLPGADYSSITARMNALIDTPIKNNGGRYSVQNDDGSYRCVIDPEGCKKELEDKVNEIKEKAQAIISGSDSEYNAEYKQQAKAKLKEMQDIEANGYMGSDGKCAEVTDLDGNKFGGDPLPSTPPPTDSSSGSTASTEDVDTQTCFASAGPMGWVLCPAISALDGILNTMYNFIEEHFLQIAVEGAFTNGSETQKAWDVMRNIANVIFVILLLLIILSQVTGFGIDNYGIKRTLPKLIIAAILVNLSFVVCQLSIDVSNIVGVGLRNLLQNLAPSGYGSDPLSAAQVAAGSVVSGSLGLGLIAAAAASATVGLPGIVVAILLAVLSAVISMLFLFIILMAREAALIMLVIVSPIALVLYMLPNTEKLAKKWLDAMKALLLLYPICSLMIGGGAFAGQVLASVSAGSDNWLIGVTAMLVQVVPYFFIPSLMRSSLKGLGDLGNRINGLGQRFNARARGAADRGLRSSERYKDAMQHRAQVRSDRFKDRQALRQTNARRRFTLARRAYTGDDKNGQPQFDFDRLNNTQKRELLEHQGRVRDIGTLDARVKSGMGRITDSSLAAQAAQYEMTDKALEVKDREALIQSGNLTTSDGKKLDSNDIGQLQGALQRELEKSENTIDTAFVKALQNMLSQKGEDGRDAVEEAMLSAQRSGKGVSGKARQAFSENIMNNWGADYKNNRRSVFEFAKANQSTGGDGSTSMQHYINTTAKGKAGSLTAEQFATMDDKEFGRYLGELSQAQKDSLGAEALTNIKNIKGNRADAIAAAMTNHYVSAGAAREALKKQAIDVNVNIPHGGGGRRRRR